MKILFNSELLEIAESEVSLKTSDGPIRLKNDYTFIFAGGELPNEFLKKIGVQMHLQKIE